MKFTNGVVEGDGTCILMPDSSMINLIIYRDDFDKLFVFFNGTNNSVYIYDNVDDNIFQTLKEYSIDYEKSLGSKFHSLIKENEDDFPYKRLKYGE